MSLLAAVAALPWTVTRTPLGALLHAAGLAPAHVAAAGGQEIDTDGDTMPDAWETFFGLDPNSAADAPGDPDGDGLSNAQEYAQRRHPLGNHARYFAEGSTGGYFETSMGVLNLSDTQTAHVALALLNEAGETVSYQFALDSRQRRTVDLNAIPGATGAVSVIVESDVPVAADRTMTWGTTGIGMSLDSGSPGPATTWYFAEGATAPFLLYYLFENPGPTPATVTVRYLIEGAPPVTKPHTLAPYSRTTVFVNTDDPALANTSLGAVITSDVPILAERAMYLPSPGGGFGGGASSSGSNALSTTWFFGEGATGPFFNAFLSMVNPGTTGATATVTYHMSDGSTASKDYGIPADGRRTVYLNAEAATAPELAALATGPVWFTVVSTQPILAERVMWWSTWPWYEGHAAPGSVATDFTWAIPEGRHGGTDFEQTYVLVGNASTTTAGSVRVTLIPDSGAASTREFAIAAGERLTLNIGVEFALSDARFSLLVESLGATAVPLTVDYARYRSVNGVPFSGGGAAPAVAVTPAGDQSPSIASTSPAANATGVAVDANLTVTFSEQVNAAPGAFTLACPSGTPIALTNLTASPATTFTLDPDIDLPINMACVLRINAAAVTDVDTIDPPDTVAADVTVPFTTSACAAITITPSISPVPGGTLTIPYGPVTFSQAGAVDPVTWSISAGALPAGLNLSAAGVLDGTPTASGPFSFTVRAATAAGCAGTLPVTIAIAAGPNEEPSFTAGPNVTTPEDGGPQTITPWATNISPGAPTEEAAQIVTFTITGNTNAALFSAPPAVSSNGTLTFTIAPNAIGSATITLIAQDNGGTAIGGDDTSNPQNFTINVTPVNDAPSFTKGADQTVFENAAPQTIAAWATSMSAGPADEAGQTFTFNVTGNTNPALFSAGPAVAADGTLTFTTAPDANGNATITLTLSDSGGTANGGVDTSAAQTLVIDVTPVNSAPSFTVGADQTIHEDAGPQTVGSWATAISAGPADEAGQTLTFNVTGNTNTGLFTAGPAVAADGTLTYTTATNATGTATITLTLSDDGGTANGGVDTSSPAQSFTITVNGVNDAPSFTKGADQTVFEEAGSQTVNGWATAISSGPTDEAGQTLTFNVTNNTNPTLFSAGPAVASDGTLTYTPAPNAAGTATITLTLSDNGGTANGGVDTSAAQTFDITLTGVNDAPSFTKGANQTVLEDAGPQTVAGWATTISAGGADESSQTLTFQVTNNTNPALFSAGPAVAADGTLTYTPATNTSGTATITLRLSDNGGTANGGVDTSATQTFDITVTDVNDAPSFTLSASHTSDEDAGGQSVSNFATALSAGGPGEGGQTLTFQVQVTGSTNPSLFSVAPALSSTGTLTYTAAPNQFGSATISVVLQDNGGTANGGVDTSAAQPFTITVNSINDAPSLQNATITYSTLGNTQLHVAGATLAGLASIADASGALLKAVASDVDGPSAASVVPLTGQDTGEGTLTIDSAGAFTYVPDAGFVGTDSFTVQVTDTVTPVNLQIQVTVGPTVWYVSNLIDANNSGTGSDGRSTNAFETLAAVQTASGDNDTIFVFTGNTVGTPLAGTIALKNGQKLWGQGIGLTIGSFGTVVAAGTRPRIVATSAEAVTVLANTANGDRTNVEVRGLNLASTTANAVDVTSANANALGVRISENTIAGSGAALEGIDITHGSTGNATLAVHDNTITASGAGIDITRSAGTVTITTFDDNAISGDTGGAGIVVTGPSVTFDATPGGALDAVSGGNTQIGASGNPVGNAGLLLNTVTGALDFTDLDVFAGVTNAVTVVGTGAFTGAAGTRITSSPGASVFTASAGGAAVLSNLSADLQLGGLSSANSTGDGVTLTNVAGVFSAAPGSSITNASGVAFNVSGGTATISYGGTIVDDLGTLVSISGTTAGTKSFTGAITDGNDGDGSGISLIGNTGATISFSGGLILSTGASAAFTATGGGTVTVCDENPCNPGATGALVNSLTTTTGTALNVANTTIGANRLEFRSISANGAASGIVLDNTGGSGGLVVTGDAGSAVNGSGGVINASTGAAISLTSTSGISLDQMIVQNGQGDGILANTVTGFGLTNSTVANNGNDLQEHGIDFTNILGTTTFTNSTFSNNETSQIRIINTTGTATITFDGVTVSSTGLASTPNGAHGLHVETQTVASADLIVRNSTFDNVFSNSIHSTNEGTGTLEFTVTNTDFTDIGASAINLAQNNSGAVRFHIDANDTFLRGANNGVSNTINVNQAGGTPAGAILEGRISNNVIGDNSSSNSASTGGYGISVMSVGSGTTTVQIDHNNIQGTAGGIRAQIGEDTNVAHTMNATIHDNVVVQTDTNSVNGIRVNIGTTSASGGDQGVAALDLFNNTSTMAGAAAANFGNAISVSTRFNTSIRMPGYAGTFNDLTAVETYLDTTKNNTATGGNPWDVLADAAPGGFFDTSPAGSAVPLPTLPTP